jgi:hypothetical protein
MKILKVKSGTSSLLKRLRERGLSKPSTPNKIVPFKYKKTIVVKSSEKLESLKKDVQSAGDSFIDIMKQGDSKVQIKLGFNNKQKMNQLMKKHF